MQNQLNQKRALIISFDLIRPGELDKSLAIASIMAYAKQHPQYGAKFSIENLSINAFETIVETEFSVFNNALQGFDLAKLDTIAISAYVWNDHLINPLINYLRENGFNNKIVLGGYQITYGARGQLVNEYPDCDIFISGYAELGMVEAIFSKKQSYKQFINSTIPYNEIPSPYLSNELIIPHDQKMIRMETKRGCPYRCSFCAHRDLTNNKVHIGQSEKVKAELKLFKEKNVKRINVLDPIFNVGKDYLSILEEIDRLKFSDTTFTLQTRFELIKGDRGEKLLSSVERTNSHLEFGLQTIIPDEYKVINRPNIQKHISELFQVLNERKISFEVSLIYGLPNQTIDTFNRSIYFLKNNGCASITAFPLMLLKGTELYDQKDKWQIKEEPIGDFNIPVVTSSNSFDKSDWLEMQNIASSLQSNNRV